MTNPFSSYLVIDAESIVRSNIHPDHIQEDLKSLLEALTHFDYLKGQNIHEGFVLGRHIVKKIDAKYGLLDLLEYFGFERENTGEFTYQQANKKEQERRKSGVNEIKELTDDLKLARNGTLNGFQEFIRNQRSDSTDDTESEDEPLPQSRSVGDRNAATLASIRSFKESLATAYDGNPSASFIRRRLARLSFQQKYPSSREFDDNILDISIDTKISLLRQKHKQTNSPLTDQICMECLIRTNFDENEALKLLKNNPPNLEVPIAPAVPQTPTQTSLANIVEPLKQQYRLLNQQNNNNNLTQQQSRSDDVWENVKYIVPAIRQIRQKSAGPTADDTVYSQLYRLLYSELLPKVSQKFSLTIELFARVICDSPSDSIENLDIITIKNILSLSIDNFDQNAKNFLSIQCPICTNFYPRNQMETMFLCNHQCCLDCLKGYYRANINNIQDIKSLSILTCFEGTGHEITAEIYMNFFTYIEAKFNQWFKDDPDFLQRYHTRKFDATRGTQIKNCGGPKCTSSFFVDENDPIASSRCTHCQFAQCRKCGKKWNQVHTEMTCKEYAEWLLYDDPEHPDNLALSYLGSNMIVCPQCNSIFQYAAGGCEHFTCETCQTNFCRMCSSLFYSPKKPPKCPVSDCKLKNGFHAHCTPNCFRELRDGTVDAIRTVLEDNGIDVSAELDAKPISTNRKCPTDGCKNNTSAATQHKLCDACYKHFLCTLIWDNHLEPWEIYEDHNLQQLLAKASVRVPATATRGDLIELCQEHLNQSLGTPRKRPRLSNK